MLQQWTAVAAGGGGLVLLCQRRRAEGLPPLLVLPGLRPLTNEGIHGRQVHVQVIRVRVDEAREFVVAGIIPAAASRVARSARENGLRRPRTAGADAVAAAPCAAGRWAAAFCGRAPATAERWRCRSRRSAGWFLRWRRWRWRRSAGWYIRMLIQRHGWFTGGKGVKQVHV